MFGREEIKGTNEQKHGFRLEGSGGGEGGAEKAAEALRREKMEVVKGKGKKNSPTGLQEVFITVLEKFEEYCSVASSIISVLHCFS